MEEEYFRQREQHTQRPRVLNGEAKSRRVIRRGCGEKWGWGGGQEPDHERLYKLWAGDTIRRLLAELLSGRSDLVLSKVTLVGGWRMDLGLF